MTDRELQQRIGDEVQRKWNRRVLIEGFQPDGYQPDGEVQRKWNRRVLIGWVIYVALLAVMAWGVWR